MSQTRFPIQVVRGVPVIGLPVVVDSRNAEVLRTTLVHLAAAGHATVVVDMSATMTCDASGRAELRRAYHHAAAEGGDLRLVGAAALTRILGDGGLGLVIPQYPTVADAVAEIPAVRIVPFRAVDTACIGGRAAPRPLAASMLAR